MILTPYTAVSRYIPSANLCAAITAEIARPQWVDRAPGKYELAGGWMMVIVDEGGRGPDYARFESHIHHIDFQLTIIGQDLIGWAPTSQLEVAESFPDRDLVFYVGKPEAWLPVPTGTIAVFFPEDAHAPLGTTGPIRKHVLKVPQGLWTAAARYPS